MKSSSSNGLLVVDKPGGMTSRAAVDRALAWFPRGTRLGHTGTLDPLATGVLVLCVGVATRLTEYVQRMEKTYRAGLLLGARSTTDDADGTVEAVQVDRPPDQGTVVCRLREFLGVIAQAPPAFSAAKVTGRRAYDLARQGKEVVLEARTVQIYQIDLLRYDYPRLDLEVRCGKGTYLRSLARDLGERLGCGGLIETLRRTRVGPFHAAGALHLETDAGTARGRLLSPAAAVADLPRLTLADAEVARLRQGQAVAVGGSTAVAHLAAGAEVAVFGPGDRLAAIAVHDPAAHCLRPAKVLPV